MRATRCPTISTLCGRLILAERASRCAPSVAERDKLAARNARLEAIIAEIRRAHFGRKSERITDDQLALALEELETSLAKAEAEDEKADAALKTARTRKRRASRGREASITCRARRWSSSPRARRAPAAAASCTSSARTAPSGSTRCRRSSRDRDAAPKYACRACEKTGADEVRA